MSVNTRFFRLLPFFLLLLSACSKTPDINQATMLDGDQIFDASLYNPSKYLVSAAISNPTAAQKNTPVIIAVHGYSASTFEWDEFRSYCDAKGNVLISQVLLGGHGRTYEEFKKSSWEDWQEPIMTEYNALRAKGYTKIFFAGSSTACPLMMDLIKKGLIGENGMKHIFFVDPIVVPANKTLSLVGVVGPMLGYLESSLESGEEGHWYHYRPQETLQQLLKVIDKVRKDLQCGFKLPNGTFMTVFKSTKDPTADAVSAVLIYKGLKNSDGSNVNIEMIESDVHVVTRLQGRDNITQRDRDIQAQVFENIYLKAVQ